MQERPDRQPRRKPPASIPQTLSLPIIPSESASGRPAAHDPTASADAARRRSRPQAANPYDSQRNSRPMRAAPDAEMSYGRGAPPPVLSSQPMRAAPRQDADSWDDDWDDERYAARRVADGAQNDMALMVPDTREMMAVTSRSRALVAAKSGAIVPIMPRAKRAARPTPPIRRSLTWQVVLLVVMGVTFFTTLSSLSGNTPGAANAFQAKAISQRDETIAQQVPTLIQIDPTIGYDSSQQYHTYSGADCSAAATAAVLSAWHDPTGNIGHVIDDMGDALSPGGLQNRIAFQRVAAAEHFNITMTDSISAAQLAQIVSVLGIPVVIAVRDRMGGYYRYFAPGHFLVVTGADANGFDIVDSSTYFVHYLPTATFMQLWDAPRAVILTPQNYQFQMP